MKYAIHRSDVDQYCRWHDDVILFETEEQAKKFMKEIPYFFEMASGVEIVPMTDSMLVNLCAIDYKDIDKQGIEHDKKVYESLANENNEMRGMLKDE